MALTERQAVVQHFKDNGITFKSTVDLAIYLADDKQQPRPKLAQQSEYVGKVLNAGYKSALTKQLFDDINAKDPGTDLSK